MQNNLSINRVGTIHRKNDDISILEISEKFQDALLGIAPNDRLDISYWMHKLVSNDRDILKVHPRGDKSKPLRGVFGVRSPMRPNPIGVTTVSVESINNLKVIVRGLDAFDGAPIVDIKSAKKSQAVNEVITAWGKIHNTITCSLFSFLTERECAELLRKPIQRIGKEAAGIEERPLTPYEIGRRIMDFESHWQITGVINKNTPGRFVREVNVCPWSGFHPTSCRILAWYKEGFVQALNPDCTYNLYEMIPAGNSRCCWSIKLNRERK